MRRISLRSAIGINLSFVAVFLQLGILQVKILNLLLVLCDLQLQMLDELLVVKLLELRNTQPFYKKTKLTLTALIIFCR